MSAPVTETADSIATKVEAVFLNGCSQDELSRLAHDLERSSNPVDAEETVDDVRSRVVAQVMRHAMQYHDQNKPDLFVDSIDRATRIAQVPVNGYHVGTHNTSWISAVKGSCNYDLRRKTYTPNRQRQHGQQERTQMVCS